jgi:hypothetical protein
MLRGTLFAASLLLCLAASCERKPGRPATELCTWEFERLLWECEDPFQNVRTEPDLGNLMCTTLDGYVTLERYVDSKEKKVRDLERQLAQCQKTKN